MEDLRVSNKLDDDFLNVMREVQAKAAFLNKLEKVRVNMWVKKLCQVTVNSVWKKNRNTYAKTLRDMLTLGKLETPFDRLPPQGHLAMLQAVTSSGYRPSSMLKPSSPKGSIQRSIPSVYSAPYLRRARSPVSVSSPRSARHTEIEHLKLQNELLTRELNEARLVTLSIKKQLAKRDVAIKSQREQIEELRAELGYDREDLPKEQELHEEGEESDFLSYLDSFQRETAQLTAETEALFTMHSRAKVPSVQLSPVRTSFEVSELHQTIEDLLGWSER